jgi:EAL domain-containing protein (putative c-di-GMP-specific phosphodiesterase class I)/ActR/RegA family two-component response regulator
VLYRGRLLILEDDPGAGKVVRAAGAASGLDSRVVTEAEQFFATLDEWQPTHLALDLVMPDVDGIQVLAALGARHCMADIIITSGMGARVLEAAGRSAREHGLNVIGLLAKPFSTRALKALLAAVALPPSTIQARRRYESGAVIGVTEAEFRSALENREFRVCYQPKIECARGRLAGFEALACWAHPQRGLIMPDQFVPFVEQHALIDSLTNYVLEEALAWFSPRFVTERDASPVGTGRSPASAVSLSVNLSAARMQDEALVDRIIACCERYRVPSGRMIFEVTGTGAMESPVAGLDMLTRLRMNGFQLSIDDFGTGYSAMKQLLSMPFTEIKVDKSFIIAATGSVESRAVVRSIVDLGRSLGLKSVAEGVEDARTLELLQQLGCDFAQGCWIGRPMEGGAVPAWMAGRG